MQQINGAECKSVTTAAVTIVVENNHEYYAFSKLICNDNNQIMAAKTFTNTQRENNLISYVGYSASDIRNVLNGQQTLDCNLPSWNKYSCSEGQIIAKIRLNDFELMKRITKDLLVEARNQHGPEINYNNVKLVVLHVGTTMDPCAICTRCLVGISKCINDNINCLAPTAGGNMNNAKFLVEVSSNGHYNGGCPPGKDDSWNNYECGRCSHTECAGHDGGEADQINIQLDQNGDYNNLAIPYGDEQNRRRRGCWQLRKTFPPYVVFGRTYRTYTVGNAPNRCTEQGHARHDPVNVLQGI